MILKKYKYFILAFAMAAMALLGVLSVAADELPPVLINPASVAKIELKEMPIKTQYLVGEKLDMSGAIITLTYDNGADPGECAVKLDWCTGFDSSKAGTKTVTITYPQTNCKTTFKVEVVTEKSLEIVKPTKLAYFVGDKEDRTGLAVSVVYSNGTTELLESGYTVSGFSSNTIGEKTITVKYKDLKATYSITVVEPALLSIKIEKNPNKLSYYIGEKLTVSGIKVTASYDDGRSVDVTSKITVSGDITSAGVKKITVSYAERDFIKSATFNVTVTDVEVKNIVFVTYPKKTVYTENEVFDPTGLAIKVTYNNGKSETVSGDAILCKGFETDTIGKKTITLHYGGKQLEFNVEVIVSESHVHNEGPFEIVTAPTCTLNGEQATTCTICMEIVSVRPIPALGHGDESDPVLTKAPTCTEPGATSTKCMVCGDVVTVSDIFPLGHTESEAEVALAPTCTEVGISKTHCTVCSAEVTVKYLDALGHGFGIWTVITQPTGETEGREERICSVCSYTEGRAMAKLEKLLMSGDAAASLGSDEYFPYATDFSAKNITESFTEQEIKALIPEGNYAVIDIFECIFTDINGERFLPEGEITYSLNYMLPEGYASYLIYDTDLGCYTPLISTDGFSFTVERVGRFVLVGEIIPETSLPESSNDPSGTSDTIGGDMTASVYPVSGSSAIIMVLIIIAVILLVMIGALVYTYAFKQY